MAPDESGATLKLRAEDADDLAVISACLQDALVAVRDLAEANAAQGALISSLAGGRAEPTFPAEPIGDE